jgi:hypothetical protein
MKNNLQIILVGIALLVLILLQWQNAKQIRELAKPAGTLYHSETIVKQDSGIKVIKVTNTIIEKSHVDSTRIYVNGPVDSADIFARFFRKHYYEWGARDSNIAFTLKDSIGLNRIMYRDFEYKLLKPQTITTNTVTLPPAVKPKKFSFYAGANFGFDSTTIKQLQPKIGIGWKGWRVDGGYDFLQKNKVIGISKDL